jgi:hypothetical protein
VLAVANRLLPAVCFPFQLRAFSYELFFPLPIAHCLPFLSVYSYELFFPIAYRLISIIHNDYKAFHHPGSRAVKFLLTIKLVKTINLLIQGVTKKRGAPGEVGF